MTSPPCPVFGDRAEAMLIEQDERAWFMRAIGPRDAPPAVLLHGFPQTGAMWAPFVAAWAAGRAEGAPARRFLIPDLPGYGLSRTAPGTEAAAKSVWAEGLVSALRTLGVERADFWGHDRGGRLAYRLALEHPESVATLAVLDILPTLAYWRGFGEADFALRMYHWTFLAQPAPLPEDMIGAAPERYVDDKLRRWSKSQDLSAFAPAALESYRDNGRVPARLAAMCDDYRAGAGPDLEADRADEAAGRRIAAPTLVLSSGAGNAERAGDAAAVWSAWAERVTAARLDCGHFLPEERPAETVAALSAFAAEGSAA